MGQIRQWNNGTYVLVQWSEMGLMTGLKLIRCFASGTDAEGAPDSPSGVANAVSQSVACRHAVSSLGASW